MSGDEHETEAAFSEAQIHAIAKVVEGVLEKSLEARRRASGDPKGESEGAPVSKRPDGSGCSTTAGECGARRETGRPGGVSGPHFPRCLACLHIAGISAGGVSVHLGRRHLVGIPTARYVFKGGVGGAIDIIDTCL